MPTRRLILALVALTMVAAACGGGGGDGGGDGGNGNDEGDDASGDTSSTTATPSALDGVSYGSTGVEGHELVAGSVITLGFADGAVTANAGCNTLGAGYRVDADTLRLDGEPRSTLMGCPEDLMAQDTWLAEFLTSGPTVSVSGDQLTLSSDDVTIRLVADAAPDGLPLSGTTWTLVGTSSGGSVSNVPTGTEPPTFEVGEDGTAQVFAGCNRGRAALGLEGSTLRFGELSLTKMMCDEAAMALETDVTTVIAADPTYVIDGDELTMTAGGTSLVFRAV